MDVEFMDLYPVIWLQVSRSDFVPCINAASLPEPQPAETPVSNVTLSTCYTTGHYLLHTVRDHDLHDHKRARYLYPGAEADVYRLMLLFES